MLKNTTLTNITEQNQTTTSPIDSKKPIITSQPVLVGNLYRGIESLATYKGEETPTAKVTVDNNNWTIKVDVISNIYPTAVYVVTNLTLFYIEHNLNSYPNITIVDEDKNVVVGDINYESDKLISVRFNQPFTGVIYLNV